MKTMIVKPNGSEVEIGAQSPFEVWDPIQAFGKPEMHVVHPIPVDLER